ncbi:hypothetical protein L226DRAFT_607915 [Lentinus tigrinus ALCF2SS1-7]|uniref:uncharacterized protein n=1 Tax=Lentinus tigrinus ALCF2SS1-7 TaxID=1328758 RepID=UPI0011660597|nr:hypothetical protein L226DRAFT_607915 [Lentinus tigrinus ALCF2SS1-7]
MVDSRCRHCFHPPSRSTQCRLRSLPALLLITALASCASASSVNRTIDDQTGDSVTGVVPTYSPPAAWKQGATCDGCFIKLDPDHVLGGTWHDATHSPNDAEPLLVTAQFTGTAVYVYNVIANTVPYTTTYTSLTFSLDGEQVGSYVHVPTSDSAFQYDVPVYTNANLANKQHTLVIEAAGDTNSSLILFDYIVYTFTEDDPTPPPSSTTTTTTAAAPPTTTSTTTTTQPVTTSSTTTSSSSLSVLPSTGSTSTLSSGTSSLSDSNTATSGDSAPSTASSSSSSSSPSSTIAAAHITQDNSSFPVGAVAGGVVGGVIVIVVLVFLIWLLRKRRNQELVKPASFAVAAPEHHMHDASDALVTAGPYEPRSGGSGAQATGLPGSVYDIAGEGSVFAPSSSGFSRSEYAAAYQINPTASTASHSGYINTQLENAAAPGSDYSSRASTADTAGQSQRSDSSHAGLRPLPVPSSLRSRSTSSGTSPAQSSLPYASPVTSPSPATTDPFVDPPSHARTDSSMSSPPSSRVHPSIPEKSPLRSSVHATRTLPVPPAHSVDAPISPSVASNGTVSILRTQVAALQEEVARLREQNEMQVFMDEAPPRYDEDGRI